MLVCWQLGVLAGIQRLNRPFWAACDYVLSHQLSKKLS